MLPHLLVATLYTNYYSVFKERILGGDEGNVSQFWSQMTNRPAYPTHPMHNHARGWNHMRRAVPIGLHCDGVVTTGSGKVWKRMVEAMSWSSLLCQRGTSYFRNYLICMLVNMLMVAKDDVNTMNDFFRELCWSLYWLYMGVHPDRDSRNRLYTAEDGILFERKFDPLAGGYFGATWTFAWDLEWMRDYIRLSGAGRLCGLCRCNTSDIPWTACTNLSAWIDTVWTDAAHQAAFPDRHRLFRHVPGVTIFCYIPDWLHTKHIGCDAYFLGSVLMAMFTEIGIAGTNTEILQYVCDHISEGYKRLDVRNDTITGLTFGMIQRSAAKLPQLKMRGGQMKKWPLSFALSG